MDDIPGHSDAALGKPGHVFCAGLVTNWVRKRAHRRERRDMEDALFKAQCYRDQALNMRTLAANEDNLDVRKTLISMADIYDRL